LKPNSSRDGICLISVKEESDKLELLLFLLLLVLTKRDSFQLTPALLLFIVLVVAEEVDALVFFRAGFGLGDDALAFEPPVDALGKEGFFASIGMEEGGGATDFIDVPRSSSSPAVSCREEAKESRGAERESVRRADPLGSVIVVVVVFGIEVVLGRGGESVLGGGGSDF
jgi:hypothetical protein